MSNDISRMHAAKFHVSPTTQDSIGPIAATPNNRALLGVPVPNSATVIVLPELDAGPTVIAPEWGPYVLGWKVVRILHWPF